MGPAATTIETAASPRTRIQPQQIYRFPVLLQKSDAAGLTSRCRPGFPNPQLPANPPPPSTAPLAPTGPAQASSEPAAKRPRLDDTNNAFDAYNRRSNCIRVQVVPHIHAALASVPRDQVNTRSLLRQVRALLLPSASLPVQLVSNTHRASSYSPS